MTGEELRAIRVRNKLTQRALAERLGVTTVTVCNYERGRRAISEPMSRLIRLSIGGRKKR